MNTDYELIKGRKYKKCKDDQIRNPKTLRCIKIKYTDDNKKATIKCPDDKILNTKTMRCVSINGAIGKKILADLLKKVTKEHKEPKAKQMMEYKEPKVKKEVKIKTKLESKLENKETKAANLIQAKMKKFLLPFTNRITANIYDRIVYYKKLVKNLNFDPKKTNYCVKFYKYDKDGKPLFRIGNNIILKKQIGSSSAHGTVYLSSFRDKNKVLFKYAVKTIPITYKTMIEVRIIEVLNNAVLKNSCPHFPLSYGNVKCLQDDLMTSSFKKSDGYDSGLKLVNKFHMTEDYLVYLTELAYGDLKTFLKSTDTYDNRANLGNALAQIFISLMFYYKEVGSYHCDAHNGNFLYHRIKPGGYFHYLIFGKNYFVPNLGYLWIIWDYEQSVSLTAKFSNHDVKLRVGYDFKTILNYFNYLTNKDDIYIIKEKIYNPLYDIPYDKKALFNYIELILNCLCELNYIERQIPFSSDVINKRPYIIDDISPA